MTHSKAITAEAATLTSQSLSSQGIATKGKKGKQSLFSKLLATLGQGKQKQNKTSEESNNQSIKVVSNPDTQQNIKTLTLTTAAPHNAENNNPLATVKESEHDKKNNSENISSQNIAVATLVQAPSVIQNLPEAKNDHPMLPSKAQGAQKTNVATLGVFSKQKIATKPNINPEKQQTSTTSQSSPQDAQKVNMVNQNIRLGQKITTDVISNINPEKQLASTTPIKEGLNLPPNQSIIAANQIELKLQSNNGIDKTPAKEGLHLNTAQMPSISPLESTVNEKQLTQTNKMEPKVERSQEQTVAEPQLASLTKASIPKTLTTNQSIDQAGAANVSATSLTKTIELGSNTSQQDFTSDQQDLNGLYMETNKHDTKLKGADFQAQLAYKSQRVFTPADTMLEIVKSAKDGSTSLELQLEPAHLGKVQVQIQMDAAKHIQVVFTVDQQTSKHALEQHMPQLRLALSQQGLDLGSFSMQMNQQQHQEHQSSRSASNTSTWTNQILEDGTQNNQIGINIATDGRLSILA